MSDKLRNLTGSDYADFDQEDLDKMYRSSMVEPAKVSDGWTSTQRNMYRHMYGEDELDKADNEVNYAKYGNTDRGRGDQAAIRALFGDGGIKNFRTGKLTEEQQMWDKARELAGIKKVNSMSDIAEIRSKVDGEMSRRRIAAGLDGYAKIEDLEALKQQDNAEPIKYNKSETLKNAENSIKDYNENKGNNFSQGDIIFGNSPRADSGGFEDYTFKPKSNAQDYADSARETVKSGQKEIGLVTRGPNMGSVANGQGYTTDADSTFDYDDSKSYADGYKLKVASNLQPTNKDGSRRPSRAAALKNSLVKNAFGGWY